MRNRRLSSTIVMRFDNAIRNPHRRKKGFRLRLLEFVTSDFQMCCENWLISLSRLLYSLFQLARRLLNTRYNSRC